jgi:outer membrane lipoprotein SlyB
MGQHGSTKRRCPLFLSFSPYRETNMKKFLIAIPLIAALGACDTYNPNTGTLAGAALGAAAGAAVSGSDDKLLGAVIGGAAGAAAGSYLGRDSSGKCVYQNTDGSRYTAACP